jgi:hypothetical protein
VRKLENKPGLRKKIMATAIEASLLKRRGPVKVEIVDGDADAPAVEDYEFVDNDSDLFL